MKILIGALLLVAAAATGALIYAATYFKKQAKAQEKIPVTPVGDIEEEGVTKVVGKIVAIDKPLTSPITESECVYFRFLVEKRIENEDDEDTKPRRRKSEDDEDEEEWETVVEDEKSVAFAVEDETGLANVETEKLKVTVNSRRRNDAGSLKELTEDQEKLLNERYPFHEFAYTKKMRYSEVVIKEGDDLMVTGDIELPKKGDPVFKSFDDKPIRLSDETVNQAAKDSLYKAKNSMIFSGVTGACTLGFAVWLVVALASKKSSSSSDSTSSSTSTESVAKNDSKEMPKIDPKDFKIDPKDFKIDPKDFKIDPKDFKIDPPKKEEPKKEEPKKELPEGRDIDAVLARAKAKVDGNDAAGAVAEFNTLIEIADPVSPKKPMVIEFLNPYLHHAMREISEPARTAYLKWSGPKDVAAVCKLLKDEPDVSFQRDILKKLAEWKDPTSAPTIVAFLKVKQTEADAIAALKAIGPDSEKDLLPLIKPPTELGLRLTVIKLLESIGGADTVAALEEVLLDKEKLLVDQARTSQAIVAKRSGATRSVEAILTALKVKALENDVAGIKQAIADLIAAAKDDAKKGTATIALLESCLVATDAGAKREMISQALTWCTNDRVPQLVAVLPELKDDVSTVMILKKLKEFKDPRSSAPVAELLKDDKHRAAAAGVLTAIGSEAEAAVIPLAKPDQKPPTRVAALQVLDALGTKECVAAIESYVADSDKDVATTAKMVIDSLITRTGAMRSLDGLLAILKATSAANDLPAARSTLKSIADSYKADHPKRAATFATLLEISKTTQQFFIKEETFMQAIRWAAAEDVPALTKLIAELADDQIDAAKDKQVQAIFDKFKELKDARCAEAIARLLLGRFRDKAADVLKEIGAPAEKAIHPYLKDIGPDKKPIKWPERKYAIEVLGEMGTSASLAALQQQARDKLDFIKDAAKAAIKKIEERKDKK